MRDNLTTDLDNVSHACEGLGGEDARQCKRSPQPSYWNAFTALCHFGVWEALIDLHATFWFTVTSLNLFAAAQSISFIPYRKTAVHVCVQVLYLVQIVTFNKPQIFLHARFPIMAYAFHFPLKLNWEIRSDYANVHTYTQIHTYMYI